MNDSISFYAIVKNEEALLEKCLESVKPIADEIIIVDTGSRDKTIDIAKKYGAIIINYKWDDSFGRARNLALDRAGSSWIFTLDADECISPKDIQKVKEFAGSRNFLAYEFPVRNYSRQCDLFRDWHKNGGRYYSEETFSQCPGYSLTKRIILFRNKKDIRYYEGRFAHTDFLLPFYKYKRYRERVKRVDIPIHHFQYKKGREPFIVSKQVGRLKDMIKNIKEVPDFALNYFNIGATLLNLGRCEEAIPYLEEAIKIESKYLLAYLVLGIACEGSGLSIKAIACLQKALCIDPGYAEAMILLGIIYDKTGKYKLAEQSLKKALKINPDHPVGRNSLGVVYQNTGLFDMAEKEYRKALKINRFFTPAIKNLKALCKKTK